VLLQATLGAYHGLAKCQIDPVQVIKWLGFLVDSEKERFEVAGPKIAKLKDFLQLVLAKQVVSSCDLAQVAGKFKKPSRQMLPRLPFTAEPSSKLSKGTSPGTRCSRIRPKSAGLSSFGWTILTPSTGGHGGRSPWLFKPQLTPLE
jgi:hypothetical protein